MTIIYTLAAAALALVVFIASSGKAAAPAKQKGKPQKTKSKPKKGAAPKSAPAPLAAPAPAAAAPAAPDSPSKRKRPKKNKSGGKAKAAPAPAPEPEPEASPEAAEEPSDDGWTVVETAAASKKLHKKKKAPAAPAEDGSVVLDLGRFASAVIGKGGETIKKLTADSGAKISVDAGAKDAAKCTLAGDAASVQKAREAVEKILKDAGYVEGGDKRDAFDAGENLKRVIGPGGATIRFIQEKSGARVDAGKKSESSVEASGTAAQVQEAMRLARLAAAGVDVAAAKTEEVALDARGVRLLIGPGGATIRGLQEAHGAKIDVPRGGGKATVSGSAEAVAAAAAAVRALLRDHAAAEVLRLDCHVGVILGKGGETVRALQKASGADVEVAPDGDGTVCTVRGSRAQLDAAKAGIQQAILKAAEGPALKEGEVREVVALPAAAVGAVVGKGGASIKKVQEDTGARLDVRDGVCIVTGPPDKVAAAAAAVKAVVGRQEQYDAERAARAAPAPTGEGDAAWGAAGGDADDWGVPADGDAWGA